MNFDFINTAFGFLSLLAFALTLLLLFGFLTARFSRNLPSWNRTLSNLSPLLFTLATLVAVVCTLSSLFLQFGENLIPCDLCWFQRICMYPQALLLGIALYRHDYQIRKYLVPLTLLGATFSLLHVFLTPILNLFGQTSLPGCSLIAPCTDSPLHIFGFLTIPMMALSGFLLITVLLLSIRPFNEPTAAS